MFTEEWLAYDQNPETRSEVLELSKQESKLALEAIMYPRIQFGTAGLRGKMGAGFAKMNDLVVIQTSQAVALYLEEQVPNAKERGIVIGRDHRHNSESFALLTAATFIKAGYKVYFYHDIVHTPIVPYTVKKKNAAAGIMITASHNPKEYNGYKLYWDNACQILSPHDENIEAKISTCGEPWTWDKDLVKTSDLCQDTDGVIDSYFKEIASLSRFQEDNEKTPLKFTYTAMHGVGYPFAKRAFDAFNFPPLIPVEEQVMPDPEFPTVEFPNPEEGKGALKLAIETANRNGSTIIIANDPDADRLAVAEKLPNGEWKLFSGNELGSVLGAASFEKAIAQGIPRDKIAMVASTVSSKFLERMAEVEGFHFEETLTGFKWIGNKSIDLKKEGYHVVFAFEEAIGFTIGDIVNDKDGVSAMAFFAEWATQLEKRGLTINQYLESLYEKYGHFVSMNSYFVTSKPSTTREVFKCIRYGSTDNEDQYQYPKKIGGYNVTAVRDLTVGHDTAAPDNKPSLPVQSSSEMITFKLENNAVLTIRGSGTEPKIKYYTEIRSDTEENGRKQLEEITLGIANDVVQYKKHDIHWHL